MQQRKNQLRIHTVFESVFFTLLAGSILLGSSAWASSSTKLSPVQKYESGVECVGYYDFGLSMMPAAAPNRSEVSRLRADWLAYARAAKSTPENVLEADITKISNDTRTIAMSGDRANITTHMTSLQSRCAALPLDESAPSVSNPFGFAPNSKMKTYVAAMQCAGKYVVAEGPDSKTTTGFKAMAKAQNPNISNKIFNEDLSAATLKSMNITIGANLNEFAALKAQCETAMPFLK